MHCWRFPGSGCYSIPRKESCGTRRYRLGSCAHWHGQVSVQRATPASLRHRRSHHQVSLPLNLFCNIFERFACVSQHFTNKKICPYSFEQQYQAMIQRYILLNKIFEKKVVSEGLFCRQFQIWIYSYIVYFVRHHNWKSVSKLFDYNMLELDSYSHFITLKHTTAVLCKADITQETLRLNYTDLIFLVSRWW